MSEDEKVENEKRFNLFSLNEERNRLTGKIEVYHRIVVISEISPNITYTEIGEYYENFFKEVSQSLQVPNPGGFLLIYENFTAHILESTMDVILEFLRDIDTCKTKNGQEIFVSSKILVTSHNVHILMYQNWDYLFLDIQSQNINSFQLEETQEKLVIDMMTMLVKLHAYIYKKGKNKANMKEIYNNLFQKVADYLPKQAELNYLLKNKTLCLSYPKDFLERFDHAYDVEFDSDFVWPIPGKNFPYH